MDLGYGNVTMQWYIALIPTSTHNGCIMGSWLTLRRRGLSCRKSNCTREFLLGVYPFFSLREAVLTCCVDVVTLYTMASENIF